MNIFNLLSFLCFGLSIYSHDNTSVSLTLLACGVIYNVGAGIIEVINKTKN